MIHHRAPLRPRQTLWLANEPVGSLEPGVAGLLHAQALLQPQGEGWQVAGSLDAIALALRDQGLLGAWRHEALPVNAPDGRRLGLIERAAVRALGIATEAVHLTGTTPDGRIWVQQRAWNKANDPGLWDTLMGGMVSAADTPQQALERETWEEAGLRLSALLDLAPGGELDIRRPSGGADPVGYTVERIRWWRCTVPDGVAPVNQDGEVERFEAVDADTLRRDAAAGRYTLEAVLILAPELIRP